MKPHKKPFVILTVVASFFFQYAMPVFSAETVHFTGVSMTDRDCVYVGKTMIDGSIGMDHEDEVGVFIDDGRGGEILVGACVTGAINSGHYFIHVYGDDFSTDEKDGAGSGDRLIFKVWDRSTDMEYRISEVTMTVENSIFFSAPPMPPRWSNNGSFGFLNLNDTLPGDVNRDQRVDLEDAITTLKALNGISSDVTKAADINEDGHIGIEEAIYIFQTISEIR